MICLKKHDLLKVLFIAVFIVAIFGHVSAAGNTSLKVISTDPTNNALMFPTTKDITVRYSSSVKFTDKKLELISSSGRSVLIQNNIYKGTLLIAHPKLQAATKYTLKIPAGAFKDLNGNLCGSYFLKFTTSSLSMNPRVTGSYPDSRSTNFPVKGSIKIYYNKQVKLETNKAELVNNKGIKSQFLIDVYKKTVSLSHLKLTSNTQYKLTLFPGCVADIEGNYCFKYVLFFKTKNKSAFLVPGGVTSNTASMQSFKYKIPYTIKNTGDAAAKNFKIRIYLTTSKSIKGTKYLIGEQVIKYLAPGKIIKLKSIYYVSSKVPKFKKYYVAVVANTVCYSYIRMMIIPYNPNY